MTALLDDLIGRLANLPPERQKQIEEEALQATASLRWLPSPGPQTDAYLSTADQVLYGGEAGGGKGQALDALVLTPFGYRPMGSLKVGSAVCNPDGSVAHVIAIYALGERQLFRVSFSDGTSTEVTDDHIWLAWESGGSRKRSRQIVSGESSARLWTTDQIRRTNKRLRIPITEAVSFNDVARYPRRPVHPYLLGVLLGDGCITGKKVRITSADPEIISRTVSVSGQKLLGPYRHPGKAVEYCLPTPHDVAQYLRKWKLAGCNSFTKFIPDAYLVGSVGERWELLRGLLDTDGWADQDGDVYYCTVSIRLRDGVATLARSLGA